MKFINLFYFIIYLVYGRVTFIFTKVISAEELSAPISCSGANTSDKGSNIQPVELDINCNNSTDQFNYFKGAIENILSYTINSGYGFNKVFEKESCRSANVIWEAKDNKYATHVNVQNSEHVTVTLVDGSTKHFEKTGGGCCGCKSKTWTEVKSGPGPIPETSESNNTSDKGSNIQPVELDIKSKKETDQYNYSSKDNLSIFEAKQGYGFNKLVQSSSHPWLKYMFCFCCCSCCCDSSCFENKTIWNSTDNEYATHVSVQNSEFLTITFADGSTKQFESSSGGCCGCCKSNTWTESSLING